MQVRIDYTSELIYSEKKKIRWAVEEFETQFGKEEKKSAHYTAKQKIRANEFLDYFISTIDITHHEVLKMLKGEIERIEKTYPILFN